jgi:hypothetical protein
MCLIISAMIMRQVLPPSGVLRCDCLVACTLLGGQLALGALQRVVQRFGDRKERRQRR